METCLNYTNAKEMYFSSDERKWITKIRKLKEKNPDEVEILAEPEENNGCIYVRLPVNYLRLQPKLRREISDEERSILVDRMRKVRSKTKQDTSNENKGE